MAQTDFGALAISQCFSFLTAILMQQEQRACDMCKETVRVHKLSPTRVV